MSANNFNIKGLSNSDVIKARKKFGENNLTYKKENNILDAVKSFISDPMVLMLLTASTIYFISGKIGDAIFLATAIVFEVTISLYQHARSKNALEKLKSLSQPNCRVIRNNVVIEITSSELVKGDFLLVDEGTSITADGDIVHSNDFSVNESILTGESLNVYKDKTSENKTIYQGTSVASGLAIAEINAIGNETKLGKIGKSLESIEVEKTPLELQIANFVKKMAIAGAIVFITVWGINYYKTLNLLDSLLQALTLAMSILPEEIPVAFTTFMALGAWRLMKTGIVVKQMKTVETLGSSTVICTDKTGTLTENKMSLAKFYVHASQKIIDAGKQFDNDEKELLRITMFASEPIPFDPMEVALHDAYEIAFDEDERTLFKMIHEYALGGVPPMMTHVFENKNGIRIIAAKGAPEAIINVSNLTEIEKEKIQENIYLLAAKGYRLLGVGEAEFNGNNFPEKQQEFKFKFKGIIAFYDPPKENIQNVLEKFYKAGIQVKILTGDNAETTIAIAKQIGFIGYDNTISGEELMLLNDVELKEKVKNTFVFTRMFPEAKLKIINALKAQDEIVAMTGDGVNDGPALKAAHIGIAMGKKGTEIAKQAASLILLEDNLDKMVDAVAMGRRIYSNLKKAIQYIISIHIPIILTVFIPLAFSWIYPNIFSPIHVIFLELIMGPTCSIIYENEPMEKNTMSQNPRPFTNTFFNWKELTTSIIQGLVITVGVLFIYQYSVQLFCNETLTRTMVFCVLMFSNIFLTLINRSFYYSIFTTIKYKNNLVLLIISISVFLTLAMIYIKPLAKFFMFNALNLKQIGICILVAIVCVFWYEFVKIYTRHFKK